MKSKRVHLIQVLWFVALSCFAAWPIIAARGVPVNHDWSWPLLTTQLQNSFTVNTSAWSPQDLGAPAIAPIAHPVFLLWSFLALILTSKAVLDLTIVFALASLAAGTASAARRLLQADWMGATIAGSCVLFGPAMYNKLVAGHIYYLIALAALAWVLALAFARNQKWSLLYAALFASLAAIQIQIFAVAWCIVTVAACVRVDEGVVARMAAPLVALLLFIPEIICALDPSVTLWYVGNQPATLAWELNNSAPVRDAIVQLGYAPRYYENAMAHAGGGAEKLLLFLVAGLAAIGFIRNRLNRNAWFVLSLWFGATLLVAGAYGPLGAPLSFAFGTFSWFGVFRELYHFAGIAWVAECVLVGAAIARIHSLALVFAAACLVGLMVPWVPNSFAGQLPSFAPAPRVVAEMLRIRQLPGDWGFVAGPAEYPVGLPGFKTRGVNPLAYPLGLHRSINGYRPSVALEAALGFLRASDDRLGDAWLRAAGIGAIVSDSGLRGAVEARVPPLANALPPSVLRLEGRADTPESSYFVPTCHICAYSALPAVPSMDLWGGEGDAFLYDAGAEERMCVRASDNGSAQLSSDPSKTWALVTAWPWIDPRAALWGGGIWTASHRAMTFVTCRTARYRLIYDGKTAIDGRKVPNTSYSSGLFLKDGLHRIETAGFVAIGPPFPREVQAVGAISAFGSVGNYDWKSADASGYLPSGTQWVVLKERYSPYWRLSLDGGKVIRHTIASGYANAWQVRISSKTRFSVAYLPQEPIRLLAISSLLLWMFAGAIVIARSSWATPRPRRTHL